MSGPLSANELRALAYFAVGVTSEGSVAGRDVAYRLSFAGNVGADGRMQPVANSGYSFGTLQIDLGQHPDVARQLLDRYQGWAATQPDRAALELDREEFQETLRSLQRTGRQMRADEAVDIDRTRINRFLASDDGQAFVHALDSAHVEAMTAVDGVIGNRDTALERLQRTGLYRDAPGSEQAELASLFMKLQNQAGRGRWPALLDQVEAGALQSSAAVKTAVDGLLRNGTGGSPDYLESGADNTLRGVRVFNALREADADNPLARAWANVVADPLVGPVVARRPDARRPDLAFEYDTVRSLFLTPDVSRRFIAALDASGLLAQGEPGPQANGSRQAGFYVSGGDFVHWSRSGQGQALIAGQWRRLHADDLTRVEHRDGTIELRHDQDGRRATLLQLDPREVAQQQVIPRRENAASQPMSERELAITAELKRQLGSWCSDERILAMMVKVREASIEGQLQGFGDRAEPMAPAAGDEVRAEGRVGDPGAGRAMAMDQFPSFG